MKKSIREKERKRLERKGKKEKRAEKKREYRIKGFQDIRGKEKEEI